MTTRPPSPPPATTSADIDRQLRTAKGCLWAAHGAYFVVAGAALGALCWIIPMLLVKIVDSGLVDKSRLGAVVTGLVAHRNLAPLMAVPAVGCGVAMLLKTRWRWLWLVLGTLAMIVPAGVLVYAFVMGMRQLYEA